MKKRNYILAAMLLSFAPPALADELGMGRVMRLGENAPASVPNPGKACAWQQEIDKLDATSRKVEEQRREAGDLQRAAAAGTAGEAI